MASARLNPVGRASTDVLFQRTPLIALVEAAVTGIAPMLVPVAAACLAVLMVGALAVVARRHPSVTTLALPTITLVLAVTVAVGRFGASPF